MFSRKETHPHWSAGGHFLLGIHWNDMPDWTIPCLLRWQHGAPRSRKVCVPEKLRVCFIDEKDGLVRVDLRMIYGLVLSDVF